MLIGILVVQKLKLARILQYGGFVVIIALLATVTVMLVEISQLRGESISAQNAAGARILGLINYMYVLMAVGFALIIGGGYYVARAMRDCIGKTFKVESVRGANSATVVFNGIKLRVVSSDDLSSNDYIKITGRSTIQGGRGRGVVYVGKKADSNDIAFSSDIAGETA